MGKQGDPLRTRAQPSRVEKSRRTHRDSRALPSWYYRVHNITFEEDREARPCDFDEDLSEIEEDKDQESDPAEQPKEEEDCACSSDDPECDCQSEDNDMSDGSERSYDGFDAYYELKGEREERKRGNLQEKLRLRKEKKRELEMETTKRRFALHTGL